MAGFIDNLRQKPERTRKQIAAGTSATVTAIIFVMWLTVLNYQPSQPEASQIAGESASPETRQTASPLSALQNNAAASFRELTDSFRPDVASSTETGAAGIELADDDRASRANQPSPVDRSQDSRASADRESDSGAEGDFWADADLPAPDGASSSQSAAALEAELESEPEDEGASAPTPAFNSRAYNANEGDGWFFR